MSLNKLKLSKEELKLEIRKQVSTYIIAAFSLVAGLAWNEAIKSLIEYFLPASNGTLLAKLVYAVVITLVVVIVSIYFVRVSKAREQATN